MRATQKSLSEGKKSIHNRSFHKENKGFVASKILKYRSEFNRFMRFCVVGTTNAVIDFGVLNFLLWKFATSNNWIVIGYNSLAVLFAATNSFIWNKYWTFQQRHRITRQEVSRFVVLTSATIVMNDLLMSILAMIFPHLMNNGAIGANVLKLAAIIGTLSVSFFGMRLWVFFHHGDTTSIENISVTDEYPI